MSVTIGNDQQSPLPPHEVSDPPSAAVKAPWRAGAIELPLVSLFVGVMLFYGWLQSSEGHLTAEDGLGYYLGIVGSVLMLALLLYPLRKRISGLRFIGGVRPWFRIHMLLGIIGPALILLHSNFSLGSFNSTIALICMLTVAGSGFVGRFLYARIHRGLYGRKAHVREFLNEAGSFKEALSTADLNTSDILQTLKDYEARRLNSTPGLIVGIWRAFTAGFAGRHIRNRVIKEMRITLNDRAKNEGWSKATRRSLLSTYRCHLDSYFAAVARAEAFSLYERLFALWHMLHLPLFIILVLAALAHVVAVHLY